MIQPSRSCPMKPVTTATLGAKNTWWTSSFRPTRMMRTVKQAP
jgi:hypothetical protein